MQSLPIRLFFFLILFSCSFGTSVFSRNYYVATTGNNNDDGSKEKPFATIDKAASLAQAGDSVIIKSGTYFQGARIIFSNSGTIAAPIVFYSEVKHAGIIDGKSTVPTIASRHGLLHVTGSNIVFDGLRIQNSGFFGILITGTLSNVTVKNCYIYNTGASGIAAVSGASNINVLYNTVQRACQAPGGSSLNTSECITMASVNGFEVAYNTVFDRKSDLNNGGEGIDAKNACSNGKIHNNVVYDLIRVGIYVDAYQKDLNNVEVYANKVYNCVRGGITVASEEGGIAKGVKVYNNLVYNIDRVGIRVAGYQNNGPLQDIDIYQNTVYNCGWKGTWENSGLLIEASNLANSGIRIRNNIISGCPMQIKSNTSQNFPITVDNNLFFGSNGSFSALTTITNTINLDPQFVDVANLDFRLKQNSPAINKATGTPIAHTDFYSFSRDEYPDLGAFEYIAATGINDIAKNFLSLKVYTNSFNNTLKVTYYTTDNAVTSIQLLDLSGRILSQHKISNTVNAENTLEIDIKSIKNGIYLCRLFTENGLNQTEKFIVSGLNN